MLGGLMRFASGGKQMVGGFATSPALRPAALTNSCFRICRRVQNQAPVGPWTHSESSGALMCRSAAVDADEAPVEIEPLPVHAMDIRVGKIIEIQQHPDADSLYVEKVDVGEEEPRTIISGLVEFVTLEEMKDREVIVLCNLKPRNMRGIKSFGMLMCASDASHERVEPLAPTPGAPVGERVFFGDGGQAQAEPETPNRVQKKKMWEGVQPDLKTDDNCAAFYKDVPMLTSAGPVTCASLTGASIS